MNISQSLLIASATVLTLSTSIPAYADEVAHSGFLTDYSRLEPNPDYPGSRDWIAPGVSATEYDAMIIDPVTIRLGKGLIADGVQPDAELLDEVLSYLHSALLREFSKHMRIVDKAGPKVVHYRAAITGVTTKGGLRSSITNLLPVVMVVRTVSGRNDVRAQVSMEAKYTDSLTGAPVGATIQSSVGEAVYSDDDAPPGITIDHLKGVLDQWAEKAAEMLNRARRPPIKHPLTD